MVPPSTPYAVAAMAEPLAVCLHAINRAGPLLNRRVLPPQIRPGGGRIAALVWSFLLFGLLSVLTFNQQIRTLFGIE